MYFLCRIHFSLIAILSVFLVSSIIAIADDLPERSVYPDMVSFGFEYPNTIVCYPNYIEYSDSAMKIPEEYWDDSIKAPAGLLDSYVYDRIGDTVTVIMAAGIFKTVIREINLFATMDSPFFGCVLAEIDTIPRPLPPDGTFAIYKNPNGYHGPYFPLEEYSPSITNLAVLTSAFWNFIGDSSTQKANRDFLESYRSETDQSRKNRLTTLYLNQFKDRNLAFLDPEFEFYVKHGVNSPDTMILAARETWTRYDLGLFLITRDETKYNVVSRLTSDTTPWGEYYAIDCAFDLDGDGNMEYLAMKDFAAEIFELENGRFEKILECGYGR